MLIMTRLILITSLLFGSLFINSCGFKSISYIENEVGEDMEARLASIVIQKSSGAKNQLLRTEIFNILNPANVKEEQQYLLVVKPSERQSPTFITGAGSSGRMLLEVNLSYSLTQIATTKRISSGNLYASESYNIENNRYGNYNAKEFARKTVYRSLAEKLRNEIIQNFD